jgi:hypothetical protein
MDKVEKAKKIINLNKKIEDYDDILSSYDANKLYEIQLSFYKEGKNIPYLFIGSDRLYKDNRLFNKIVDLIRLEKKKLEQELEEL